MKEFLCYWLIRFTDGVHFVDAPGQRMTKEDWKAFGESNLKELTRAWTVILFQHQVS